MALSFLVEMQVYLSALARQVLIVVESFESFVYQGYKIFGGVAAIGHDFLDVYRDKFFDERGQGAVFSLELFPVFGT